jgi:hypothetical protein
MSIEYYESQEARLRKAMQNKNTLLWKEWREDFDKRQAKKQDKKKLASALRKYHETKRNTP